MFLYFFRHLRRGREFLLLTFFLYLFYVQRSFYFRKAAGFAKNYGLDSFNLERLSRFKVYSI